MRPDEAGEPTLVLNTTNDASAALADRRWHEDPPTR
jgi:hypothetical protein